MPMLMDTFLTWSAAITFDWLDRVVEQIKDFYYKSFIAYMMLGACVFATVSLQEKVPIWPLNYYTIVWTFALFFPVSAGFYLMFNLRVRLNEILDVAQRNQFCFVYYPGSSETQSQRRFANFLRQRFAEYFNLMELAGFSLIAGTVVFLAGLFFAVQFSPPIDLRPLVLPLKIDSWVVANGASFLGGLSGAFVLIFKRYRTFDIYPSTYLQVSVALLAGTLAGGFITMLWPVPETTFIAFSAGFLTSINVNFLSRLLRQQFAKLTGAELPPDIATDLFLVIKNSEAIESLNNISLFSIAEFAKTEALRIYLNMSQPVGVINGWMDEALLYYYFSTRIDALRAVHIQRFTQLMEVLVDQFLDRAITWREQVKIIGDATADSDILTTVKTIVASRFHHRLLGFLSDNYRKAYFLPADKPA